MAAIAICVLKKVHILLMIMKILIPILLTVRSVEKLPEAQNSV